MNHPSRSPAGSTAAGDGAADITAVVARLRAAGCVFAEDEAALLLAEAGSSAHLEELVDRRLAGLPLEQVLGWAQFRGHRVVMEPGVFVPRRRTELLVEEAVALAATRRAPAPLIVVDLCCGTGAIGLAIAAALGEVELHAADVDPVAVRCARRNVAGVGGTVHEGDLDAPLPASLRGRVSLLVACPPYVPTDSLRLMPSEARQHEPRRALDGGPDGLDVVRRLAAVAVRWLAPGGHLLVEAGEPQTADAVQVLATHGLVPRVVVSEELGARVVVGTHPSAG